MFCFLLFQPAPPEKVSGTLLRCPRSRPGRRRFWRTNASKHHAVLLLLESRISGAIRRNREETRNSCPELGPGLLRTHVPERTRPESPDGSRKSRPGCPRPGIFPNVVSPPRRMAARNQVPPIEKQQRTIGEKIKIFFSAGPHPPYNRRPRSPDEWP